MRTRQGYPRLIADDWQGLTRVDAALTLYESGNAQTQRDTYTFIFSGSQRYLYNNMERQAANTVPLDWSLPRDLDAAFQWGRNGRVYVIKGTSYSNSCISALKQDGATTHVMK